MPNCDIKDMLLSWLGDNDTSDWPMGLKFMQFYKNNSSHSVINKSPYNFHLHALCARIGMHRFAAMSNSVGILL